MLHPSALQRQALPALQCSTSGRYRHERLAFCRATHRRLPVGGEGGGVATCAAAGARLPGPLRPCGLLGLPVRPGLHRRLRLTCAAEEGRSGKEPGGSSSTPGGGNSSSDEGAPPERRPQPPKSGEGPDGCSWAG